MVGRLTHATLLLGALVLSACASLSAKDNDPLIGPKTDDFYALDGLHAEPENDEAIIVIAFSGGGKRSSAFGFGAMEAFQRVMIGGGARARSLLSDADVISGVSGGSFVAAGYGYQRAEFFTKFRKRFLEHDLEADIYGLFLLPWRWDWLFNAQWGRNDEMARVYGRLLFRDGDAHEATYADLQRLGRPFIAIQATDLATSDTFLFSQTTFDLICSDLATFPLARAVAASNAFPGLFSPVTLINRRTEACPVAVPHWIEEGLKAPPVSRLRFQAETAHHYVNPADGAYVHLVDGGVADNLALRGLYDFVGRPDDARPLRVREAIARARRIIFISVDGQAVNDPEIGRVPVFDDFFRVLDAVTSGAIDRLNYETLLAGDALLTDFAAAINARRCAADPDAEGVQAYFAHVALKDASNADDLKNIPTGLTIGSADIERLIEAGRNQADSNAEIGRFVREFGMRRNACEAAGSVTQ
ncbi:MAG TPA: patatin-like phospholipase family protein [Micropepsaceae bacterium]|nr:patatin-like phospholipase family protein [Micropepsaceae bacterium]